MWSAEASRYQVSSLLPLTCRPPPQLGWWLANPINHPVLIPLCSSTGLHRTTPGFYGDARIRTLVLMLV